MGRRALRLADMEHGIGRRAAALVAAQGERFRPVLLDLLASGKGAARPFAVLGELQAYNARETIAALLQDPSGLVGAQAASVLAALGPAGRA